MIRLSDRIKAAYYKVSRLIITMTVTGIRHCQLGKKVRVMTRVGIYNHQHYRGGCPGCSQTYVKGMIADGVKCQNRAIGIYGNDCEFINYTDLGDYPPENLDRPGFKRMMKDVEDHKLDAIFVLTLSKISNDIDLVLQTYKKCKENDVALMTALDGKKVMKVLDKALEKWEKK